MPSSAAIGDEGSLYDRMERIEGWSQKRMKASSAFVAGMGALGCEVAKNLVLMGLGHLFICDYDEIEISNVSRQMLYRIEDRGKPKVDVARTRLKAMNPYVEVEALNYKIEEVDRKIYNESDLLLSCLDSFGPRRFLNTVSIAQGKPLIDAGCSELQGNVMAFHPPKTACRECNPMIPMKERRAFCTLPGMPRKKALIRGHKMDYATLQRLESKRIAPTMLSATSIIAGLQTQEAIKIIQGIGTPLYAMCLFYNGDAPDPTKTFTVLKLRRNPYCPACGGSRGGDLIIPAYREETLNSLLQRLVKVVGFPDLTLVRRGQILYEAHWEASTGRTHESRTRALSTSLGDLGFSDGERLTLMSSFDVRPRTVIIAL